MFTTIEWDWATNHEPWRVEGLAIPVVNEDDERSLVAELRMDARGINNGWVDTMPVEREPFGFVDADDPRNGNPPLVVEENRKP